ncbi:MAG: TolC family protein [Acidobacteria bacterium]|nr:TolC family protein [Acidobacteriota bacterium]
MLCQRVFPILGVSLALVAQAPAPESKRLSLQDAIVTALQNNLQVQISRETRSATQSGVLSAEGAFDWTLSSSLNWSRAESTTFRPAFTGAAPTKNESTTWSRTFSAGLAKPFEWGGNLSINYNPSYSFSSGRIVNGLTDSGGNVLGDRLTATAAPYTGTMSATYTQSLLKNFGRQVAESGAIVARLSAKSADFTFQKAIIDLVASTESSYWDVVFAQRNLENKKQALALARKQLRENQIRVEVGTLAPIEVTSAEASVAQREQDIISAEAQFLNAKDALIRALFPNAERPAGLELTDAPKITPINLDESGATKMALERRVELKSAKLDLESKNVLEFAASNRLKPQLDAFATYSGSSDNYRAVGPVNGDLFNSRNPGYTLGLNFSLPLMNKAAEGSLASARASRRSSELSKRDLELGITLEVRTAIRNVEAAEKGVKAAEKTRIFREKDLEAEQKKFENGMSTNFLVLSKQNDLDTAKSAEVQAQITYAKSLTSMEKAVGNLLDARNLKLD